MNKVWIIAQHEYFVNLRRPGFIIMTALIPLLGVVGLVVAAFFGGQASDFLERTFVNQPTRIGVVDQVGAFTPVLTEYQERYRLYEDEASGRVALEADEISTLFVIAGNYMETGRILVYSQESRFQAAILEDSTSIRRFFVDHLLRDEMDQNLRDRLADPIEPVIISLEEGEAEDEGVGAVLNFMVPYFLSILLIMTVFVSSGYLLQSVADEKTSRVIEILLSSVTARELLAGKVLGLGALGLTQIAIWLAAAGGLSGGAVALLGIAIPLSTCLEKR